MNLSRMYQPTKKGVCYESTLLGGILWACCQGVGILIVYKHRCEGGGGGQTGGDESFTRKKLEVISGTVSGSKKIQSV